MKWVLLSARNLIRNPRRSLLTLFAILLAVFIYSTLLTLLESLQLTGSDSESGQRLAVLERYAGPRRELPLYYGRELGRFDHVTAVSPLSFTLSTPGLSVTGPFFVTYAVDPGPYGQIFPAIRRGIGLDAFTCIEKNRMGALLGRIILEQQNWTTGETIELHSLLHGVSIPLLVCGSIRDVDGSRPESESQILIRRDYFGEVTGNTSKVNMFWIGLERAVHAPTVALQITDHYSDGPEEVILESEGAILSQMSQFTATIQLLLKSISWIVLGTVVIVSGNTIAIAIRERWHEIALLKTIGYTPVHVLLLILAEGTLLALTGGWIGTAASWMLFQLEALTSSMGVAYAYRFEISRLVSNSILSALLGMVSAGIPAWNASRMNTVEGLRR